MTRAVARTAALYLGALAFLFPFYYMIVGSLQSEPDTSLRGAFPTSGLTLGNYSDINSRVDLLRSLTNSGIFTGGVILGTIVFGVLAGYALARLHFRGRGTLFALMLLVQIIPFQLLIIPIYVMIVRTYGLADTYLGMIARSPSTPRLCSSSASSSSLCPRSSSPQRGWTARVSCASCGRWRCHSCGQRW